jgi:cellulose biosynthesis protein BcsQ
MFKRVQISAWVQTDSFGYANGGAGGRLVPRETFTMSRIIALYSHQRECCKTSAALNLATLLTRLDKRVFLISPEESASQFEGEGMVVLIPDLGLDPLPAWSLSLDESEQEADVTILDGPPSALLARVDDIILVCDPLQPLGLAALAQAEMDIVAAMSSSSRTHVLGVLMTRTDQDLAQFEQALLAVEAHLPFDVFPFSVPGAKSLPSEDPRVVLTDPASRQARGYIELSMEVLSHER